MANDLDDAIGDMVDDLHAEAGETFTYRSGSTSATVTLRKSMQMSQYIDNGMGQIVEVRPIDFIGLRADLPVDEPHRGDRIVSGAEVFEVMPTLGEKPYRVISPKMIRIHTKLVKE